MRNLIFIGPPGSGKGTQANVLKEYKYTHVSTGDLLREEVKSGSPLGEKINSIISKGELVSDDVVRELLVSRLDLANNSYIFDGFPRNINQAVVLEEILKDYEFSVVYFDVDSEEIISRICSRRVAVRSGHIYNLKTNPPKKVGVCDVSGEALVHREDDTEDVVKNRFSIYEKVKSELLDFYKDNEIITIDGRLSPSDVSKELIEKLF